MPPFVRHGGVTVVANDDGVFVTALTKNVDLKFRIPGAVAIRAGRVTVCVFDLRDILKERVVKSAKTLPLTLALTGKTGVALSIAKHSWQLERLDV
jgi:hypothetical protein